MTDGFSSPVLGGGGALIRPSEHSPDYAPGTAGWTIKKDGSAEFNNLTVRGSFVGFEYVLNNDGAFFYNGTPAAGNLLASIASAAGTDPFGNHFPAGITSISGSTTFNQLLGNAIVFGQGVATITGKEGLINSETGFDALELITPGYQPGTTSQLQAFFTSANATARSGLRLTDSSGTASSDVKFSGAAVKVDPVGNALGPQAVAMAAGFTNVSLSYYADGVDSVAAHGAFTMNAASAGAGAAFFTTATPPIYWPKTTYGDSCAWLSAGSVAKGSAVVRFNTNGTWSLIWPAATAAGDRFEFSKTFPLGNI